jgi:predicted nucleotidyltransferase
MRGSSSASETDMIYIRFAVSLVVLLVAGWLGYRWGASGLEAARAQLHAIEQTATAAKTAHDAAQQQIDAQLKAQAADHEAKLKTLAAEHEAQQQALAGSLSRANERIAALSTQRQGANTQLDQIRREMASATGAHREELIQREQQVLALQKQLDQQAQGLSCLSASVPADELALLNRVGQSQ